MPGILMFRGVSTVCVSKLLWVGVVTLGHLLGIVLGAVVVVD